MNPDSLRQQLGDDIFSGHAYLHVLTTEKTRFLAELKTLAESLPDGGHFFRQNRISPNPGRGRRATPEWLPGSTHSRRLPGSTSAQLASRPH